jgi:hypothetical protein
MVVAANKADLPKTKWEVPAEEIKRFSESVGANWFETSAKMGTGKRRRIRRKEGRGGQTEERGGRVRFLVTERLAEIA